MNNKIYIVGTIHAQKTKLIEEELYQLLGEIRPDIVLFEFPIEAKDQMLQWLDASIKADGGMEARVLKRYMQDHQIILLPYDIKGRNDYYLNNRFPFIEEDRETILADLLQRPDVSPLTHTLNEMNDALDKIFWGDLDNLSLRDINTADSDSRAKHHIALSQAIDRALIELTPELRPYLKTYELWSKYENRRERAMARNILAYNNQYSNSTMVLICGFYHRFTIIELLRKARDADFTLISDIFGAEESSSPSR